MKLYISLLSESSLQIQDSDGSTDLKMVLLITSGHNVGDVGNNDLNLKIEQG